MEQRLYIGLQRKKKKKHLSEWNKVLWLIFFFQCTKGSLLRITLFIAEAMSWLNIPFRVKKYSSKMKLNCFTCQQENHRWFVLTTQSQNKFSLFKNPSISILMETFLCEGGSILTLNSLAYIVLVQNHAFLLGKKMFF